MGKYKLPTEQVVSLQKEQRALHDILTDMDEAESCGIDCQSYRAAHKDASDRIDALLRTYGTTPNSQQ